MASLVTINFNLRTLKLTTKMSTRHASKSLVLPLFDNLISSIYGIPVMPSFVFSFIKQT